MSRWILLTLFWLPSHLQAHELNLSTEANSTASSGSLSYTYQKELEDSNFQLDHWFTSLSANRYQSTDENNQSTWVKSTSFDFGLDFETYKNFNITLQGLYSKSPDVQSTHRGYQLGLSYSQWETAWPFTIGLGVGNTNIQQELEITLVNKTVRRTLSYDQKMGEVFASVTPLNGLTLKLKLRSYQYTQSTTDLKRAYNSQLANALVTNYVSAIGGLPDKSSLFDLSFSLTENWELLTSFENTHLVVDDSTYKRKEISLYHYLEKWNWGAGLSQIESSQGKENSVLLYLGFLF